MPTTPSLSIIIKALNEEDKIQACLKSIQAANKPLDTEIILADSLSIDNTIALACQFPITIVQLTHEHERSCGIGAQLGYQYARGHYICIIDADMHLDADFLPRAIAYLDENPEVAGLAGHVQEVNQNNFQFRSRHQQNQTRHCFLDRLTQGGVYRKKALEEAGYFTHKHLHSSEEFELGLRLTHLNWKLNRLDIPFVSHHGHTMNSWKLLIHRFQSRYFDGFGELIRVSFRKPWFIKTIKETKIYWFIVISWILLLVSLFVPVFLNAYVCLIGLSYFAISFKKRSIAHGVFSFISWHLIAIAMLRGLLKSVNIPTAAIDSILIREKSNA